jgi:hypothetical protein
MKCPHPFHPEGWSSVLSNSQRLWFLHEKKKIAFIRTFRVTPALACGAGVRVKIFLTLENP